MSVLLVTSGIAWGGLLQRVKTLEREVAALSGFADLLSRIDERTNHTAKELDKLTGSWLFREPPPYVPRAPDKHGR